LIVRFKEMRPPELVGYLPSRFSKLQRRFTVARRGTELVSVLAQGEKANYCASKDKDCRIDFETKQDQQDCNRHGRSGEAGHRPLCHREVVVTR
jgi:hypothetical protein